MVHYPDKLIGDKAYDSDPLDQKLLEEHGIELIALRWSLRHRRPLHDFNETADRYNETKEVIDLLDLKNLENFK